MGQSVLNVLNVGLSVRLAHYRELSGRPMRESCSVYVCVCVVYWSGCACLLVVTKPNTKSLVWLSKTSIMAKLWTGRERWGRFAAKGLSTPCLKSAAESSSVCLHWTRLFFFSIFHSLREWQVMQTEKWIRTHAASLSGIKYLNTGPTASRHMLIRCRVNCQHLSGQD